MKRETLLRTSGLLGKLRQLGDQEVDIVQMVQGVTKYARMVTDPSSICYHLGRALNLATQGRPGPVWLDIPLDVQAAEVDPGAMPQYDGAEDALVWDEALLRAQAEDVARRLLEAERPVLLGGTGVRLAGAIPEFQELGELLGMPITTAWTHDLLPSSHPLFCGRQGTIGTRAGNFVVQNADFVLIIGSRMCIRQISYNWASFARHAHTVQVDVDAAELDKPTFKAKQTVHADARHFLRILLDVLKARECSASGRSKWLRWCQERQRELPNVLPSQRMAAEGTVNQYHFIELLFANSQPGTIFACGDATACITPFQAGFLKEGQRMFSNSGSASMGYDLPSAIGAALAAPEQTVVCLAGDGSVQMNIQELATVAHHKLNIKIFILNNGGYLSIRSTQANFFKLLVGEGPASGVSFPDFVALSRAYGLPAVGMDLSRSAEFLSEVLGRQGPEVVVVELDRAQGFEPKLTSKRMPDGRLVTAPLEDMAPFLDRNEFARHMIIPASE
jgi:acetolactate synthase-1/2/3 large subunit